jgi:hypothetical protein
MRCSNANLVALLNDHFLIFGVCGERSGSNCTDRRLRREQLGVFDDFLLIFGEMRRIVIPRLGLAWLWLKPRLQAIFFSAVYGALGAGNASKPSWNVKKGHLCDFRQKRPVQTDKIDIKTKLNMPSKC